MPMREHGRVRLGELYAQPLRVFRKGPALARVEKQLFARGLYPEAQAMRQQILISSPQRTMSRMKGGLTGFSGTML